MGFHQACWVDSLGLWTQHFSQGPLGMRFTTPGIQSPDQQAALARHNPAQPIFVEGPFSLWLHNKCVYYHILRAELVPPEERVRMQILNGEDVLGWHCPEGWWGFRDWGGGG